MTFGTYLRRRYGGFSTFRAEDVYMRDSRGRHRMVVGLTTTCAISAYHYTKVVSSNSAHREVYSMLYYVIKFVGYLRQAGSSGFLHQ